MDRHLRRTRPARYHDNHRPGREAEDWRLDQVREREAFEQDHRDDEEDEYEAFST